MLHELGIEYDLEPVQSRSGETQTDAYLALNPRGKIPLLEHDGGADFAVADVLLTSCLVWAKFLGQPLPPRLDAYCERTTGRASYGRAFAANFPPAVLDAMRREASRGGST